MSNGGGESGKELEGNKISKKIPRNEEFVQAIAKMAVAQVCESSGFQGFQQSALNTLSDIAVRYITHLGNIANSNANLSGRTECNVFDILQGLEDVGMLEGFSGASEMDRCLASSGVVRNLIEYVEFAEEIPFSYSIPRFPVLKDRKLTASFVRIGEPPPGEHIPAWLPAFPSPETYACMPDESNLVGNEGVDKSKNVKEHKKLGGSRSNIHQLLDYNGSKMPVSVEWGKASNMKRAAHNNPFLVAPLRFGEKDISPVVPPARFSDDSVVPDPADPANHVSALEAFAPATDAVKSNGFDSGETNTKVFLDNRPPVQFKLQIGKNSVGTLMNIHNESVARNSSSIGDVNVNDDKKRRAEQILKESMENPEKLAHL